MIKIDHNSWSVMTHDLMDIIWSEIQNHFDPPDPLIAWSESLWFIDHLIRITLIHDHLIRITLIYWSPDQNHFDPLITWSDSLWSIDQNHCDQSHLITDQLVTWFQTVFVSETDFLRLFQRWTGASWELCEQGRTEKTFQNNSPLCRHEPAGRSQPKIHTGMYTCS